jgi:hypothetical protein
MLTVKYCITLNIRKACGLDGIPNECLRLLPRRPLVHLTHLINHCLRLSHFPKPWKEAKIITLPKPGKDPKFPQNLRPISLLSTTGKLFERVILKIVQRHIEEKGLINASQFGSCLERLQKRLVSCPRFEPRNTRTLLDTRTLVANRCTIPGDVRATVFSCLWLHVFDLRTFTTYLFFLTAVPQFCAASSRYKLAFKYFYSCWRSRTHSPVTIRATRRNRVTGRSKHAQNYSALTRARFYNGSRFYI